MYNNPVMPNQRKYDKKLMTLWLPIATYYRFMKYARSLDLPASQIMMSFIEAKAAQINLTEKDYENIAEEIRRRNQGK